MKLKSILVSALCVAALSGYGQTEKGTFLLGGSLTFSHNDNTTTFANGGMTSKQVNIRLSPSISYFVIKRLAVGVITPYTYTRITANDQHATGHTYAVGPIARYYFLLGNHWAIFPEASYTYGWMKNPLLLTDSNNQAFKSSGNTHEFQGGIGGVYFLNKSIGLEGKFYYDASHSDYNARAFSYLEDGSTDITSLNFSAGVQIYFSRNAQ